MDKDSALRAAFNWIRDHSIIDPMMALSEPPLTPGDMLLKIESDKKTKELVERSLKEAVIVFRHILPSYTLDQAREGLLANLDFTRNRVLKMVQDLLVGDLPDTRSGSDWLIKTAHSRGFRL